MTLYDGKPCEYDSLNLNVSKLEVSTISCFLPHCSVLFCFMSHGRPLSRAPFHLSISAWCAVSSHNKSYFTNVLIDVGQTFVYKGSFGGVTEWHDWSLHDKQSVLNNVQSTTAAIRSLCGCLSCLYSELSWKKLRAFCLRRLPNASSCIFFITAEHIFVLFSSLSLFVLSVLITHGLTKRNN